MVVDVEDGLLAVLAGVGDHAEAAFVDAEFAGGRLDALVDFQEGLGVVLVEAEHVLDVFFRDDEGVGRGDRVDVVEGEDVVVFVDFFRGDFACDDFAENAVHGC